MKQLLQKNLLRILFIIVILETICFIVLGIVYGLSKRELADIKRAQASSERRDNDGKAAVVHTDYDCQSDPTKEYSLSSKDGYELVVLCGGTTVPNDATSVVVDDGVFLKDLKTGKYFGSIAYESPIRSSFKIVSVSYPRIYIVSCYEGCGGATMIELYNGPNDPFHYFDLTTVLYRNNVASFINVVGDTVVVAGERKVATLDPETFALKTIFSVGENETIGFSDPFPIFESSVTTVDAHHIQVKVYEGEDRYIKAYEDGTISKPKEKYTKTIAI